MVSLVAVPKRDGRGSLPGEETVAGFHVAVFAKIGEGLGGGLQGHDRADGRLAGGLDGGGVPAHHGLAARDRVALVDQQLEAFAVELHGVDAEVDEHSVTLRVDDDEGVRVERHDDSVDGGDGLGGLTHGSIAVPGPTIAPEKTGSGTADSPMARPASGDVTVVMGSLPGVEIQVVVTACPGRRTVQQVMSR